MVRKNPLVFRSDEYEFLHRVYLAQPMKSKIHQAIVRKRGMRLDKRQILFIKRKFSEWRTQNQNQLLWLNEEQVIPN